MVNLISGTKLSFQILRVIRKSIFRKTEQSKLNHTLISIKNFSTLNSTFGIQILYAPDFSPGAAVFIIMKKLISNTKSPRTVQYARENLVI